MKIGYARVSTEEQNLALQQQALKAAGCERIYEDKGVSGTAIERPALRRALRAAKRNDVLVVWKLDRLGRDLRHLVNLAHELTAKGVGFKVLEGHGAEIDTTTANGRLIFGIFAALAEFERELISERTRAGMAAAKRAGKHIGRPRKLTDKQLARARAPRSLSASTSTWRRCGLRTCRDSICQRVACMPRDDSGPKYSGSPRSSSKIRCQLCSICT